MKLKNERIKKKEKVHHWY